MKDEWGNMFESKQEEMIPGINPSIAKLVYLFELAGFETFESHASFYPGDREEQEYWVNRIDILSKYQDKLNENDYKRKKLHSPILLKEKS